MRGKQINAEATAYSLKRDMSTPHCLDRRSWSPLLPEACCRFIISPMVIPSVMEGSSSSSPKGSTIRMGPFRAGVGEVFSRVAGAGATAARFGGLLLPVLLEKGLKDDRSLALLVVSCMGKGTMAGSGLAWFVFPV
jgi:hypothetical protein